MTRPAWAVARRVLSVPILGLGALLLLWLSVDWLTMFRSVGAGVIGIALLGGLTAGLLAAGFALFGRKYLEIIAGVLFTGIGFQVALIAIVFALAARGDLGALIPSGLDLSTSRAMAAGSAVSAVGLVGVGVVLLLPAILRWVRKILAVEDPIFVWAVLAWQVHVGVSALASIVFARSYGEILPEETRRYMAEFRPHAEASVVVLAVLGLVAAFYLVRRRKAALWLFVGKAGLRAVDALFLGAFALPPGIPEVVWVFGWAHGAAIEIAILGYVVWLHHRGTLR
jgi:hypothetical protein